MFTHSLSWQAWLKRCQQREFISHFCTQRLISMCYWPLYYSHNKQMLVSFCVGALETNRSKIRLKNNMKLSLSVALFNQRPFNTYNTPHESEFNWIRFEIHQISVNAVCPFWSMWIGIQLAILINHKLICQCISVSPALVEQSAVCRCAGVHTLWGDSLFSLSWIFICLDPNAKSAKLTILWSTCPSLRMVPTV